MYSYSWPAHGLSYYLSHVCLFLPSQVPECSSLPLYAYFLLYSYWWSVCSLILVSLVQYCLKVDIIVQKCWEHTSIYLQSLCDQNANYWGSASVEVFFDGINLGLQSQRWITLYIWTAWAAFRGKCETQWGMVDLRLNWMLMTRTVPALWLRGLGVYMVLLFVVFPGWYSSLYLGCLAAAREKCW